MSTPQRQAPQPQGSQPQQKRIRERHRSRGSQVINSANILESQTPVIAEDLYNEPVRTNRNSSTISGKYVPFFDERNAYAKQLLSLVNNSPTLRRVIQDKTAMTIGDGFNVFDGVINPMLSFVKKSLKNVGIEDKRSIEINNQLVRVNKSNESLQDVLQKGVYDFFAVGNGFFELVKVQTSEGVKTYLYHIPVYMVAFEKMEADMVKRNVGIYETWEKDINSINEIRNVAIYPSVTPVNEEDGTVTERSVIAIQNYAPGYSYWGLPDWIGAKHYAELEYRAARYNINEFENGFIPSAIVTFFGSLDEDEGRKLMRDFKESYTGTKNHKKVFAQVVRDENMAAKVQTIETNKQGDYIELLKLAAQNIVTSARWTMSAAGFSSPGQMGTNQQLRSEIEYLQNTVIKPIQNAFIQTVVQPYINYLAEENSVFTNISLEFSNAMPISFLGDINIENTMTIDEKREILGLAPLTPAQKAQLLTEMSNNKNVINA